MASRLWFDCTPEHVFYRFRGGRIAQVWSLIDVTGSAVNSRPEVRSA